jgi:GTP-binding protein
MSNIIAIVGRPNVGKSTLFNRLTETRQAIVDDESGVTRDRHYGQSDWSGQFFTVVDTGGYVVGSEDVFESAIREQVLITIEEADAIFFLVDVTTGITDLDDAIASVLRKSKKPVFVVANKVDNNFLYSETAVFYALGLGDVFPISSMTGSGTGELLDEAMKVLKPEPIEPPESTIPKYAILGKPNVGKSSLINVLAGTQRNIVTPIAGTTRDSIHVTYNQFGQEFMLIDTAGLRKKTKVRENLEFYSVMRSIRALEESDVVLLMIDAQEGLDSQDINIFHLAEKNKKGIVILVNKWDLIEKNNKTTSVFEEEIRTRLAPFSDIPIVFTSIPEKQRVYKAIDMAKRVYENRKQKISTSHLNDVMLEIIERTPPPSIKGKSIKIKYITQVTGVCPSFVFFCNLPQYIKEPYKRFIENQLREKFDLLGTPILLYFRQK